MHYAESAATIPSKAGFVTKFCHRWYHEQPGKNGLYKNRYERKETVAYLVPGARSARARES